MIGEKLNHYRILAQIGSGGMGAVYRAEDQKLRREIALKILPVDLTDNSDRLERFQREARSVAALNHPNIVTLFSVEEDAGRHFITMELVKGQPLDRVIPKNGFSTKEFLELAIPMADAVAAAHEKGITHRDLKPGNVMIDESRRVKIIDFGLAKAAAQDSSAGVMTEQATAAATMEGRVLGTPAYMSPEQVEGKPVDHRSDIFALGILYHEMLTGDRPFRGDSNISVMSAILKDDPQTISSLRPEVPAEIARLIRRCLQKNPAERVQTSLDIRNELKEVYKDFISGTLSAVRLAPVAQKQATQVLVPSIVAIAVLAAAVAAYWKWSAQPVQTAAPAQAASPAKAQTPAAPVPTGIPSITRLATTDRLEAMPVFSPDGRHIAFVSTVGKFKQIFIRDIGSSEARQLTTGEYDHLLPAWGPDTNTMYYAKSATEGTPIVTAEISEGSYGELNANIVRYRFSDGDAVTVARQANYPAVAPGGQNLFFIHKFRVHMSALNGTRVSQLSTDAKDHNAHTEPKVSADGSKVVFRIENVREGVHHLAIVTTNHQQTVVKADGRHFTPAWHPSGKFIYFSMYRGSGRNIWRLPVGADNTAAGPPEAVTVGGGSDMEPAFSPDGWRMAFSVSSVNADILRMSIDPVTGRTNGPAPERMPFCSNREDSRAFWAPSTNELMMSFNSDRGGDMNIYIWRQRDNSVTQVTTGPGGDYQAVWSPDLQKLAFFSSRSGDAEIYVVSTNANSKPVQLTQNPGLDFNPFFSTDGKQIAYTSERDGLGQLRVMNADGSNERLLSREADMGHFLPWHDAESILCQKGDNNYHRFFASDGRTEKLPSMDPFPKVGGHASYAPDRKRIMDLNWDHTTIWVVSLTGNEGYPIWEKPHPDANLDYPCWSPDGRWATFDYALPRQSELLLAEWKKP